jgi:fructose-1,6-bisphosphatase I
MIEIYNAIINIAIHIEDAVFKDTKRFLQESNKETMHTNIKEYCSDIIEQELSRVHTIQSVISEDYQERIFSNIHGKYIMSYVAVDNIDLVDVNFSLGSIFGIYENELQPTNLVAAAYVTYGPTFQLVFATKKEGVMFFSHEKHGFVQEESFTLDSKGKINSTGGDAPTWSDEHKAFIKSLFNEGYRLRFSDALSLDTHQILFKRGGLYSSPSTGKHPNGKTNLLFEAYPIAHIIELAGGMAIDGKKRILDKRYEEMSDTTPFYFGSNEECEKVLEAMSS